MAIQPARSRGATATTAAVFGTLAGIGGLTHGVGEVLQGDVAVGFFLDSWTSGPIFTNLGGEPGLTVLPTALSAGVATLVISAAVVLWSALGVTRERGGGMLTLLSFGMLLAGGGVGPPVIGMLAGGVGVMGVARRRRRLGPTTTPIRWRLSRRWPALFAIALANCVFLVVGSVVLVYTIDLNQPRLFEWSFYLAGVTLLLLMLAGPAYDARRERVEQGLRVQTTPDRSAVREPRGRADVAVADVSSAYVSLWRRQVRGGP